MSSNLLISLQITALGMGLVFGAIILLALMMSLLTRFTAEKEVVPGATTPDSAESPSGTAPATVMEQEYKAQAAAIAVATALADLKPQTLYDPPTALVSAWQLGMRTRQMYEKGGR